MVLLNRLSLSFIFMFYVCFSAWGDPQTKFRPNLSKESRPTIEIKKNTPVQLIFNVALPTGFHLNKEAPSDIVVFQGSKVLLEQRLLHQNFQGFLPSFLSDTELVVLSTIYFCKGSDTMCHMQSFEMRQPLKITSAQNSSILIEVRGKLQ